MDIFAHLEVFHSQIAQWYDSFGRKDLPWRHFRRDGSEAYQIYVSEIMLQQTQVNRVLESYYFPFLERFPTLESLASANQDELFLYWEGLGYYSRARNMQKTAKICVQQFCAKLPDTFSSLCALPGIGAYTAGAILCFGFGRAMYFVDANIKRLFCRLFALENPSQKELESITKKALDMDSSFEYNQALIDLGALICTTKTPKCLICPLAYCCLGKLHPERFPTIPKKHYESLTLDVLVLRDRDRIALQKSESRLYFGLYNLPMITHLDSRILCEICHFKHSYTKYKIQARVWEMRTNSLQKSQEHLRALGIDTNRLEFFDIGRLPAMANLSKKAMAKIL